MTEILSSVISPIVGSAGKAAPAKVMQLAQLENSSQRFTGALNSAIEANGPAIQAQAAAPVRNVQSADGVNAADRARRTLELDGRTPQVTAPQGGDTILDGLQKLRGVFDRQQARVNQVTSGPITDMKTMLAVQMEVVNYSVLVDVTSKLTGKSTQAFETLLKGQ